MHYLVEEAVPTLESGGKLRGECITIKHFYKAHCLSTKRER